MELAHSVRVSEGADNGKVTFVVGTPSWDGNPFSDSARSFLYDSAKRAGIQRSDIRFECVLGEIPASRKAHTLSADRLEQWKANCLERLARLQSNVFVPVDSLSLSTLTEHSSMDKWHLSIIPATKLSGRKCVPVYGPEHVQKIYSDSPFMIYGLHRVLEEMSSPGIKRKPRIFHINPKFDQVIAWCQRCEHSEYLSVDIENNPGQITLVGFAPNPTEAMAIPVAPGDWTDEQFYLIWKAIGKVLASPALKIFQNFIHEAQWFSRYGFVIKNLWHDTMHANKFLHPELPCSLANVGRLYTREPFWKDEGRNWRDPKSSGNWNDYQIYNCKDTSHTMEAAFAQQRDLIERKLDARFYNFIMPLARPVSEMCFRGLPVDLAERTALTLDRGTQVTNLNSELSLEAMPVLGRPFNSRSPKQVKEFFHAKGYKLPTKRSTNGPKETTDVTALLKLQFKYPKDRSLGMLLRLSELNKSISSYLKPAPYPDGRLRYAANIHGADTGRFSFSKDTWENGLNPQTVPSDLKRMFKAPEGWRFLECDLRQADARVVAWDAPEPTLMRFFTEGRDIHRFVASRPELFNKLESEITHEERQLGKKTGHAANYGMRGTTLAEQCLKEMGLVISPDRAQRMLDGYHNTFPGIRMWQNRICTEIKRTKRLTTPLGRERYFYDRLGDDLYRVAYAYRPQSVVADVTNTLMLHVERHRHPEKLHMLVQIHDSLLTLVRNDYLAEACQILATESDWNPILSLSGGPLQIPIEIKHGSCWGAMHEYKLGDGT